MNKREIGTKYERLACKVLEEAGCKILATNYRKKIGEIDIVCMDGSELVFVEVKFRKNTDFGGGESAIDKRKQMRIRKVAEWFMAEFGFPMNTFCRFDAVVIDGDRVEHFKNAW